MISLKRFPFLLLLFILFFQSSKGQLNFDFTEGKFLIKGIVGDLQTHAPLPNANIIITNRQKGITCSNDGRFTMYIGVKDTLRFTSVGYIAKTIAVTQLDSMQYYSLTVELMRDFYKLKDVVIYPFGTKEEFHTAFMAATNKNIITIPGMETHPYNPNGAPAKFNNTISYLYERLKRKKSVADPNFKP